MSMKAVVFDTETTGLLLPSSAPLADQPRIIEIGAVLTDGKEVLHVLSQIINPEIEIGAEITRITSIRNEDFEGMPTFEEYYDTLRCMFEDASYLICHNAPFDVGMLANEILRMEAPAAFPWPQNIICTAQEYTARFGARPSMKDLYKEIIGVELKQTHRALDDAMALHEILYKDEFYRFLS